MNSETWSLRGFASGRQMRVSQPNALRQGTGDRIRWDDRVWLSWDASSPVVVTQ